MRVASLTCSNTEIVCALGMSHVLVAVDDHSDHPEEVVSKLPRLGPDLSIDVDALEELQPDITLASLTVPGHEKVVEEIRAKGLEYMAPDPRCIGDIYRDIRDISKALGVSSRGEALIQWMQRGLETSSVDHEESLTDTAVTDKAVRELAPVLVEWWPKPVFIPARHSWINEMLHIAGGVNPWKDAPGHSMEVETESVLAHNPEVVIISWCGVDPAKYNPEKVIQRNGWAEVRAVRDRSVFCVAESYLGRPGPRIVEGVRRLRIAIRAARRGSS